MYPIVLLPGDKSRLVSVSLYCGGCTGVYNYDELPREEHLDTDIEKLVCPDCGATKFSSL